MVETLSLISLFWSDFYINEHTLSSTPLPTPFSSELTVFFFFLGKQLNKIKKNRSLFRQFIFEQSIHCYANNVFCFRSYWVQVFLDFCCCCCCTVSFIWRYSNYCGTFVESGEKKRKSMPITMTIHSHMPTWRHTIHNSNEHLYYNE